MLRVLAPIFKHVLQQIRLQGFFYVGGKTRNIAIQLVMQQCCKISYAFFFVFFFALFTVPYRDKRRCWIDSFRLTIDDFFSWAIPALVTSSYNNVFSFFSGIHSENLARVWNFMKISLLVSQ